MCTFPVAQIRRRRGVNSCSEWKCVPHTITMMRAFQLQPHHRLYSSAARVQ
uniref:Uncharacterized protein n=1 Tax=Eimeria tenella TaxID=5802 RepID=H9B9K9_EIMTE|nr:hypothetical protein [Eimeria tenella]